MARIFIMGSGVVGTATGRGFLDAGHDVTFIDISPDQRGRLEAAGLDAREALVLPDEPSFVFLTLPTPHVGRRYDLTAFRAGTASVGAALADSGAVHTVVIRSTVPPNTSDEMVRPLLERESGKTCEDGFYLASNPEFLRAASAAADFRHPWMTVVAARNKRTAERLVALLTPFGGDLRVFGDPRTAELIKCAHNIYNATKISFWNEMWLVAQTMGLNHDEVASTVALSAEGSTNPAYGLRGGAPYGGVCLPKDTNGFLGFAGGIGVEMPLLDAVVRVNEHLAAVATEEMDGILAVPRQRAVVDLNVSDPADVGA